MAEDVTLDKKERRFDAALDNLQRTAEAGATVPDEIFDEFFVAAQEHRKDQNYEALLGSAGRGSDRIS